MALKKKIHCWKLPSLLAAILPAFRPSKYPEFFFTFPCCFSFFWQYRLMEQNSAMALFESVAICENLTSFEISIAQCFPPVDLQHICGVLSNNFSLTRLWFYQSHTIGESFNKVVDRNKFLQQQQRFKSVKLAQPLILNSSKPTVSEKIVKTQTTKKFKNKSKSSGVHKKFLENALYKWVKDCCRPTS